VSGFFKREEVTVADPSRLELVIVAIPSDDDRTWKVSSEKVPHITLLYLGSPNWDGNQMAEVASYVQHAAANFHSFGMSVDHRGVLGDKSADVLFFNKSWSFKELERFRSQLRANQDIDKAYLSADQYPSWTPHLTLGYPETPAHKDTNDYPISWVNFDKIAMWVGDSEGPTFKLNEDRGLEVAMSQVLNAQEVEEILEHYGVKGMKWGHRKDEKWAKTIYSVRGAVALHNHVAHKMNNGLIDKHNNDPRWKGKNLNTNRKLAELYYKEYAKLNDRVYKQSVNEVHGISPSGTKRAVYVNDSQGPRIEIRDVNARHADPIPMPDRTIKLKLDANGFITDANTADEGVIEHYGVKGMKWGKRKSRQTEASHPDSQHVTDIHMRVKAQKTTRPLSNKELQDAITRMNLEQQYSRLSGGNDRTRVQKGRVLIGKILADSGKQVVTQTVTGQLKGLADQAVKK